MNEWKCAWHQIYQWVQLISAPKCLWNPFIPFHLPCWFEPPSPLVSTTKQFPHWSASPPSCSSPNSVLMAGRLIFLKYKWYATPLFKIIPSLSIVLRIESKHLTTLTLTDYPPNYTGLLSVPQTCQALSSFQASALTIPFSWNALYMVFSYFPGLSENCIEAFPDCTIKSNLPWLYSSLCLLPL